MPERMSYATSWEMYIDGHIVSKSSLRFITNLLTATAASRIEQSDDSSEDSVVEAWRNLDLQVGNLDLVHQTLQGIAARSSDEGQKALGRHARTIRLGRSLWQSDPLASEIVASMQERMFDDGCFPPLAEMRSIVAKAKKPEGQQPASFANKTQPYVALSVVTYGTRLRSWMDAIMLEAETPTTEQFSLLQVVCDRVLLEFQSEKEGSFAKRAS
jgi:hypothetical protein